MNSKYVSYIGILLLAGILSTTTTNSDAPTRSACALLNNMAAQSASLAAKSSSIGAKVTQLKDFLKPFRSMRSQQTRKKIPAYTRGSGIGTKITQSDIDIAAVIGFEIMTSGTYKLDEDLIADTANTTAMIKISADNVVLDLCGRTISNGVLFFSTIISIDAANVIIRNGTINASINFGITSTAAGDRTWTKNLTIIATATSPAIEYLGSEALITNCTCIGSGFAAINLAGSNAIVDTSTASGAGIEQGGSSAVLNSTTDGLVNGIKTSSVSSVLVRNSTIQDSATGIRVDGTTDAVFLSNTIKNNQVGVNDSNVAPTDKNFFGNNSATGNTITGYDLTASGYFSDQPPIACPLDLTNYWCNCES